MQIHYTRNLNPRRFELGTTMSYSNGLLCHSSSRTRTFKNYSCLNSEAASLTDSF